MNIWNLLLHFLTVVTGVALFIILWRARCQFFAKINNAWHYMLAGLGILVVARTAYSWTMLGENSYSLDTLRAVTGLCGFALLAFGLYRWVSAAHTLSSHVSDIRDANSQLQSELVRNTACLAIVPAALYRFRQTRDGDITNFEFANDWIEKILGYSIKDLERTTDPIEWLMHPDDHLSYVQRDLPLFISGKLDVLEHRVRNASGEYRWFRRYLRRLDSSAEDCIDWVGCGFDVTDLKNAEERLHKFLDAAPDAVLTLGNDGVILAANAQASKLFQDARESLSGKHLSELLPGFELVSEDGPVEVTGVRADGSEFPAEIKLSSMSCGDEQLFACAVRDLTGRRQVEAQLRQAQKMEAVGQLTGGVAHDFNNLLTIVIGNLQLLDLDDDRIDDKHRLREAALDAALRGAQLTRRLLAFSRQQVLSPKVLYVNELVLGIVPMLERALGEVVTLHTVLADDIWATRVDPSQLENSLVNLAINARDAMPSGGRLTVETSNVHMDVDDTMPTSEAEPGDYVLITVSDTGSGIPADVLPQVFDPFFSTKGTGKGSGLGLSMVHGFVKQSAGHIRIYSESGHGTTVKIYLPRSGRDAEDDIGFTTSREGIPCGDETILIVEDEEPVRVLATEMLTLLGYTVFATQTGADALQVLSKNSEIDLLFTDIVMPGGMTGVELAQQARESWPALRVLFTSGYTNTALYENRLLTTDDRFLNKPYRLEELAQRIRDSLDSGDDE